MCCYGRDVGDTGSMHTDVPRVPTEEEWVALGFIGMTELGGGWQSRVFGAEGTAGSLAVKLTQAHLVDRQVLERKAVVVDDLARLDASVVAPVPVCGSFVYPFGEWLVTATSLVEGDRLDGSNAAHGELVGASLAGLHRSMREVSAVDIPRVAGLRSDAGHWGLSAESDQLLHGDFNTSNLILTGAGIRIFDFDDCGYGPIEFDVANSIYMVGFDSWAKEGSMATFRAFRSACVAGYSRCSDRTLEDASIDSLIDTRVMALSRWTANPSAAPIGIRNSPAEWIETLERFVREWFSQDGETHP
jgi:Ser/Thr protein kinase RdoA (MazF antagonist)